MNEGPLYDYRYYVFNIHKHSRDITTILKKLKNTLDKESAIHIDGQIRKIIADNFSQLEYLDNQFMTQYNVVKIWPESLQLISESIKLNNSSNVPYVIEMLQTFFVDEISYTDQYIQMYKEKKIDFNKQLENVYPLKIFAHKDESTTSLLKTRQIFKILINNCQIYFDYRALEQPTNHKDLLLIQNQNDYIRYDNFINKKFKISRNHGYYKIDTKGVNKEIMVNNQLDMNTLRRIKQGSVKVTSCAVYIYSNNIIVTQLKTI